MSSQSTTQKPDLTEAIAPPTRLSPPNVPFTPCHMFFYGSLMDTTQLKYITALPSTSTPDLLPATITGFRMKMWSIYPTLIASNHNESVSAVKGMLWKCETETQFESLVRYETDAYTWCFCTARLDDGTVLEGVRTFCWAGEPGSRELEEGTFDLEGWRTNSTFLKIDFDF
ncbi:hypothetical protein LSUB1_G002443 [Lachnellula subtilissima]|uniref:Putative gamma-glutamylcyclotransferase n=1 Tax=Lachnellula subtilissima TaxID=602034 RepID=A0A8H8UDZ3_9HELO|nr:hypothetical protein LSUB1_G002443 [Lachnellula subtilissima]